MFFPKQSINQLHKNHKTRPLHNLMTDQKNFQLSLEASQKKHQQLNIELKHEVENYTRLIAQQKALEQLEIKQTSKALTLQPRDGSGMTAIATSTVSAQQTPSQLISSFAWPGITQSTPLQQNAASTDLSDSKIKQIEADLQIIENEIKYLSTAIAALENQIKEVRETTLAAALEKEQKGLKDLQDLEEPKPGQPAQSQQAQHENLASALEWPAAEAKFI